MVEIAPESPFPLFDHETIEAVGCKKSRFPVMAARLLWSEGMRKLPGSGHCFRQEKHRGFSLPILTGEREVSVCNPTSSNLALVWTKRTKGPRGESNCKHAIWRTGFCRTALHSVHRIISQVGKPV